jgi:SAM-dependent MidA family methyltransferase
VNRLEQKIAEKIKKEGRITFEAFMDMALYEPGLGYYASEDIEIGKAGDFYTSQNVHHIFGVMIGKQLEEMWEAMGRPPAFDAIEPGAGAALMAMDILTYLRDREISGAFRYVIIEPRPFMQKRQKELLGDLSGKVEWVGSLEDLESSKGCILSNELLDAFPVHVVKMEDELREVYVTLEDHNFTEKEGTPSTAALSDYLRDFSVDLPGGYRTEINLRIKDWLRTAGEVLSEGFLLTVDYGYPAQDYYSEERDKGTLLCYHKHNVSEELYRNIGEQDITAHVNFSSVKKWGEEIGLKTLGFCQQGIYLISLGIDEVIKQLYADSQDYLFEVAKIKRLIFPGTLGETHKVMIQYRGQGEPKLRGFAMKNQKDRL